MEGDSVCGFGGRPARVATRTASSTGLTRCRSKPAASPFFTASWSPQPVRAMTAICRAPRLLAQAAADLVAVEQRQADVQQHHVGQERFRQPRSGGLAVVRHAHSWPCSASSPTCFRRRPGCRRPPGSSAARQAPAASRRTELAAAAVRGRSSGSVTTNTLPWPTPALRRLDPAAVQLDQVLDQRQADAEAAARAGQRAFDLGEHRRTPCASSSAGMPMPSSLTVTLTSAPSTLGRELDAAAAIGVLGGVGEQVDEHLRQPRRDRRRATSGASGRRTTELVAALVDAAAGWSPPPSSSTRRQVDALAAQLDPALVDAAHVHQVVDQPDHRRRPGGR